MPKKRFRIPNRWAHALGSFLLSAWAFHSSSQAQNLEYALMSDFMPVTDASGRSLTMPWTGGLNSAQIGQAEVNGDDREDLVIYDRYARLVHTLIQTDSGLSWQPEFALPLLDRVESWVLFADVTGDGNADLLTAHPFGIQVYAYEKQPDGSVGWMHYPTALNEAYLQAESPNGLVNIQVSRADVIGIRDADGDGDQDLWVFNFSTGTTINYYRNTSVETTGTMGALTFQRETNFWGGLSDCGCGAVALDSILCRPAAVEHAGGKSLTILAPNGATGPGILFGDELCEQPVWLDNTGNALAPQLQEQFLTDSLPSWQSLLFPAGYFLGQDTLVFSTNLSENPLRTVDFSHTLHRYTRQGSTWQRQEDNWLQQDMLDVGAEAAPTWADLDLDGDPDLLVAQAGLGDGLHIWWNEGSLDEPTLVQGPSYLPNAGLRNWKVWVADLTEDGKPEIIMAGRNPNSAAHIFFYAELNDAFEPINWVPWSFTLFNGENMDLADIDRDGLLEAVIGLPAGRIRLLENNGTNLEPEWEETESEFLGLGNDANRVFVRPVFGDVNADGEPDLLYTSQSGEVIWFSDINTPSIRTPQTLVDASGAPLEFPANTQISLIGWELGKPAYLCVGLPGGGIRWYRPLSEGPATEFPTWAVYPNPTAGRLSIRSAETAEYWLVTTQGKILEQGTLEAQAPVLLDLSALPEGLYAVQLVWADGRRQSRSVIKFP
ncbi:MAG TPA: hypothetical protein DCP28_09235 [Cytophagales bacterium]|nr:hypothetical protein [Cytophagales bacterium]